MQIETDRLLIRPWTTSDLPAFAEINADPAVRRYYYPSILTRIQSDRVIEECMRHLREHRFAFLATARKEDGVLMGGTGISWTHDVPGDPTVEIGWILGRPFWRQGYARESGLAWFAHAWSLGLTEIIGYTSEINTPSRAQMEALGMIRDPREDFADPTVPTGNPLSPHVLYRLQNPGAAHLKP
jgi:RimJ/RimL family protein N-acetyltransferase